MVATEPYGDLSISIWLCVRWVFCTSLRGVTIRSALTGFWIFQITPCDLENKTVPLETKVLFIDASFFCCSKLARTVGVSESCPKICLSCGFCAYTGCDSNMLRDSIAAKTSHTARCRLIDVICFTPT